MTKYVFTYHGGSGMAETEEAVAEQMARWGAWMGGLGDTLVDGGNPFAGTRTVHGDGSVTDGGQAGTGGFSILAADSYDAAVAHARGCPVLADGGTVEVHEAIDM